LSRARKGDALRRWGQPAFDALVGRRGMVAMTLAYVTLAAALLAYVCTHVYTSALMEDLNRRRAEVRELEEKAARLTAAYASLSSRARISSYCEERLGMVEAGGDRIVRVRLEEGDAPAGERWRFQSDERTAFNEAGPQIGWMTEVIRR